MLTQRLLGVPRRPIPLPISIPISVGSFGHRRTIGGITRNIPEQVKLNQVTVQLCPSSKPTADQVELQKHAIKLISSNLRVPSTYDAAVILASKSLASWLDDATFISRLLGATADPLNGRRLRVLTAAVDEVPRYHRNGIFASGEGISILPAKSDSVFPGLWPYDESSSSSLSRTAAADTKPSLQFHVPYMGHGREDMSDPELQVTIPLANTIFENGRSHTFTVAEWSAVTDGKPGATTTAEAWHMGSKIEKTTQTVILPTDSEHGILLSTSLIPLTKPRKILAGLGNILRQVEIDQALTPASKELEDVIPKLLGKRAKTPYLATEEGGRGPVGVWALIIPKDVAEAVSVAERFVAPINLKNYRTSEEWELTQVTSPYVSRLLSWGCQLRKIPKKVSGGGGWGSKKGLLSLDPETSLNTEEEEDLESFIRSFKGEDASSGGGIVTPGSYVQFFAEGIYPRQYGKRQMHPHSSAYALGTSSKGVTYYNLKKKMPIQEQAEVFENGWKVQPGLFGAVSAEAIYVSSEDDPEHDAFKTKVDAPGSFMVMSPSLPVTIRYNDLYMTVDEAQQYGELQALLKELREEEEEVVEEEDNEEEIVEKVKSKD